VQLEPNDGATWSLTTDGAAPGVTASGSSISTLLGRQVPGVVTVNIGTTARPGSFSLGLHARSNAGGAEVRGSLPVVIPEDIAPDPGFRIRASGDESVCGLTTANVAACWGYNIKGQLGISSTVEHWPSSPVSADDTFTSIASGAQHSCALTSDGKAY